MDLGGICTGIELFCETYHLSEKKRRRQLLHLKDKVDRHSEKDRENVVRQITNLDSKFTKQKNVNAHRMCMRTTKYRQKQNNCKNALHFEINTRLYTTAFLSGASYTKTASTLATLNCGSANNEQGFYRIQHTICKSIREVSRDVINEDMNSEIKVTIIDCLCDQSIPHDRAIDIH